MLLKELKYIGKQKFKNKYKYIIYINIYFRIIKWNIYKLKINDFFINEAKKIQIFNLKHLL